MENENLVIVSKVKRLIKDRQGLNTSASFFVPLNDDIKNSCIEAGKHAEQNGRKTVLGRDFNFYVEDPKFDDTLVVTSKIKKLVKENSGLNTSQQVIDQLSYRVQEVCLNAIKSAVEGKRKTVLDRDFNSPVESLS